MGKRRSSHAILEWIGVTNIGVADNTIERESIDLVLDDDEIAEIWKIDSDIVLSRVAVAANAAVLIDSSLYTDPTVSLSAAPSAENSYEDLEQIMLHTEHIVYEYAEATETGGVALKQAFNKVVSFQDHPVIVANNLAMLSRSVGTGITPTCSFFMKIYFTRRRASEIELARTLLKRR